MSNKCPTCHGAKKQTLTVTVWRPGGDGPATKQEIPCVACDGTGVVSDARLEQVREHAKMWCRCDEPTEPSFYDDGQHPHLHKHHWRCAVCDGVTQVG